MKKILTTTIAVFALAITTFAQSGSIDTTFNPGTGASDNVWTTSIQNNGKIIIGGTFTMYNGTVSNRIARLNNDGTLDVTFNSGIGPNGSVETSSIQSDGKIIIGGNFTLYNGTFINKIARLNTDGTLDTTFNQGTGPDDAVWNISIQSNGKIIIGGQFESYNGTTRNRIARLNTDGTLDISFNPGTGADSQVWAHSIQSDGKIIIGGSFTSYDGISINGIARLNTNGTLDTTFSSGIGANYIAYTTSIQSDGKVIIGGEFPTYNGTTRNNIARLNVDGSLDMNFDPGTGTDADVFTTSVQSDGQLIIGGAFTTYNGTAKNRIVRLNTDGTLDATFDPGAGANADVWTNSIQGDGNIIIGGSFTSYNGMGRHRIARILGTPTTGLLSISTSTSIVIYPNPFSLKTTIQSDHFLKNATMTVYNMQGQAIKEIKNISAQTVTLFRDNLKNGLYFIQLKEENKIITENKLVVID